MGGVEVEVVVVAAGEVGLRCGRGETRGGEGEEEGEVMLVEAAEGRE